VSHKVSLTGKTRLLGIIGHPVKGSLYPRMQNAALRHHGIDALYLPFEIPPSALAGVMKALPALNFRGLNVTIPYKEKVLRYLDEVTEEARQLGAVNCILVDKGRLLGYNTDGAGFTTALKAEGGLSLRDENILILGAGGAAKAIAFHVARQGCRRICIANRTVSRASSLRRRLQRFHPGVEIEVSGLSGRNFREAVASSQVLVNTTSVGMARRDPSIVPGRHLSPSHLVVDIVYKPLRTPLLRAAERSGARFLNGLGMLLYQGALAFRIWTGRTAPVDVMKRALRSAPEIRP
jgi:shikimate dehydrogenase